jgi:hypothetical protein
MFLRVSIDCRGPNGFALAGAHEINVTWILLFGEEKKT